MSAQDNHLDTNTALRVALVTQLLRVADDHLILGHRLSEWCGHAPLLEEDLALPNIALDLIGQARSLYTYAGKLEGQGRDEDAIAYRRRESEYMNLLMCERPNGDFAHTMVRQLCFSIYMNLYWQSATDSTDATISAIAAKAVKESEYHVRHTGQWVIRLGDGTVESSRRTQNAVEILSPYIKELFDTDDNCRSVIDAGLLPDPTRIEQPWQAELTIILEQATLSLPDCSYGHSGGRHGRHTEDMGYLLSDLQFLQHSYPNLHW